MVVGILTISLDIPGASSLKDKRQVVKSLLDGIRNRFGVSAAEVGDNDIWRRAVVGVACVSNERKVANGALDKVVDFVESHPEIAISAIDMEFV
jgi:uncharacterized protein YlxP (DUF503 family)